MSRPHLVIAHPPDLLDPLHRVPPADLSQLGLDDALGGAEGRRRRRRGAGFAGDVFSRGGEGFAAAVQVDGGVAAAQTPGEKEFKKNM